MAAETFGFSIAYRGIKNEDGTVDAALLGESISAFSELFLETQKILGGSRPVPIRMTARIQRGSAVAQILAFDAFQHAVGSVVSAKNTLDAVNAMLDSVIKSAQVVGIPFVGAGALAATYAKIKDFRHKSAMRALEKAKAEADLDASRSQAEQNQRLNEAKIERAQAKLERERSLLQISKIRQAHQLTKYYSSDRAQRNIRAFLEPIYQNESSSMAVGADGRDGLEVSATDLQFVQSAAVAAAASIRRTELISVSEDNRKKIILTASNRETGANGWKAVLDGENVAIKILDHEFLRDIKFGDQQITLGDTLDVYVRHSVYENKDGKRRSVFEVQRVLGVNPAT